MIAREFQDSWMVGCAYSTRYGKAFPEFCKKMDLPESQEKFCTVEVLYILRKWDPACP